MFSVFSNYFATFMKFRVWITVHGIYYENRLSKPAPSYQKEVKYWWILVTCFLRSLLKCSRSITIAYSLSSDIPRSKSWVSWIFGFAMQIQKEEMDTTFFGTEYLSQLNQCNSAERLIHLLLLSETTSYIPSKVFRNYAKKYWKDMVELAILCCIFYLLFMVKTQVISVVSIFFISCLPTFKYNSIRRYYFLITTFTVFW